MILKLFLTSPMIIAIASRVRLTYFQPTEHFGQCIFVTVSIIILL